MERKMMFLVLWLMMIGSINMYGQNFMPKNLTGVECSSTLHVDKCEFKKKWKLVLGEKFDYRAKPDNGDPKWSWSIGSGNCTSFTPFWNISSLMGDFSAYKNNGAIITNMPTSNSDLGEAKGIVKVNNSTESSCQKKDGTDAKVKIFFKKDETTNPGGTEPNWFYYWSQIPLIQSLLSSPAGFKLYDRPNCVFNTNNTPVSLSLLYDGITYPFNPTGSSTFGSCSFIPYNMPKEDLYSTTPPSCISILDPNNLAITSYGNSQVITLGEGCGFSKAVDICNPGLGNINGIHTFYSTVIHEVEHAIINSEIWSYTNSSAPNVGGGYLTSYDMDKDGYKDIWEQYIGFSFNFNPGTNDSYATTYSSCFCAGSCSAGSMYEETRCRNKENTSNLKLIDQYDWSYDPTDPKSIKNQGKQW